MFNSQICKYIFNVAIDYSSFTFLGKHQLDISICKGFDAQTLVVLFYDIHKYFGYLFASICVRSLFCITKSVSLCNLGENKSQEDVGKIEHLYLG